MTRPVPYLVTLVALLATALVVAVSATAAAADRWVLFSDGSTIEPVPSGTCPDPALGEPLRSIVGPGTEDEARLALQDPTGSGVEPGLGAAAADCDEASPPPEEETPRPPKPPVDEPDDDNGFPGVEDGSEGDDGAFPGVEPAPTPGGGSGGGSGSGGGGSNSGGGGQGSGGGGGGSGGFGPGGSGGSGGSGGGGIPQMRNGDGSPARSNPTLTRAPAPGRDPLGAPTSATSVPNFVIEEFRVPIFLLPIYQAAGTQYGVRWEVLAAINEIETDYGRNLNVSYAGALGWMQFMPASWRAYGVDANKDGVKDPYNPVDAIFAAARYLDAAGYAKDVRGAIFAYNHADWYVDSVLMRARLIAGVPSDLSGSLTGLTEGRFPVYAKARYADDLSEQQAQELVARDGNAAQVHASDPSRRGIEIYTRQGAPVIATNDGEIKQIGRDSKGHFVVLQDVYGNRYSYRGLSEVADSYPVPKSQPRALDAVPASDSAAATPTRAASAGRQPQQALHANPAQGGDGKGKGKNDNKNAGSGGDRSGSAGVQKQRLFAHPQRPRAMRAGGAAQLESAPVRTQAQAGMAKGFELYDAQFAKPFSLDRKGTRPAKLREGSRVVGGTILGKVGTPDPQKASHLYFTIQPAGRGAPLIDPKPILDGWKLLEETAIYRARGQNVLQGGATVGQLLLLSKPLLERRVLADSRIEVYDCGRSDIQSGQIDRRVLITLAYLAESGLRPSVTSLKCGHSVYTSSGNVSNHSTGNAVDIAQLNGIPVLGHQERGGITDQAVKRILQLQGTMRPDELISLLDYGGPSFAMGDHHDHIHVGFTPLYGSNKKLGKQALAILRPGQWHNLIDRLADIDQPNVVEGPKRFTLPGRRASKAHGGE